MEKLLRKINLMLVVLIISILIVSAVEIANVNIIPSKVKPSEKANIYIKLNNNFDKTIENINIKLDLTNKDIPFAPLETGTEKIIDKLRSDEETTISFEVITFPDAQHKIYKIPLIISYEDNNKLITKNEVISISVESLPFLEVSIEENLLIKDLQQELNINLINKGLSNAKFVSIRLEETNQFNILSQNSFYIGNLDSDETETMQLNIFVNKLQNSEINLLIKISYKDENNNEHLEEKEIKIKLISKEEAKKLGVLKNTDYAKIAFFAFIILILILYISYRRKK